MLQFDQHRAARHGLEQADEFRSFDRKFFRVGVLAVEDRWDAIDFAQAARRAAARLGARGYVERELSSHSFVPPETPEAGAGVLERGSVERSDPGERNQNFGLASYGNVAPALRSTPPRP